MEALGLNNDVTLGGKKFHIQTSYSQPQGKIISNVFLNGQVIESNEVNVEKNLPAERIGQLMKNTHQSMITEMEILYYISEKVKAVRHAPSANKLGLLFIKRNLPDEAIEQFRLALEIDPFYSEAYVNLGKAYLLTQSFDKAVKVLKQGEEKAPDFADLKNYLGLAYIYKQEFKEAIDYLEKALEINKKYKDVHLNLAFALLGEAIHTGSVNLPAIQLIRNRIIQHLDNSINGQEIRQQRVEKVKELLLDENYQEAYQILQTEGNRILSDQVCDFENEFYLKFMYGGKGKDDQFIEQYINKLQELLKKNPDYADIRNNLGVAYLIQCRNLFLKSLEEFRTALKLNPNFKKAEKNLKLAENDGKGFLILLRAILK